MKLAVVGTGYVGLVSGVCLAHVGHEVVCVDRDPERVATVARGEVPFYEPGLDALLRECLAAGRFSATTDLAAAVRGSALSLLCVGTPLIERQGPDGTTDARHDYSYLESAARAVGEALKDRDNADYHVVAVKSTVAPGTTARLVRPLVAAASGRAADGFGVAMNPEFLREGLAVDDFMNPDRVVVGADDERAARIVADLYAAFDCPKLLTTLSNAELIKCAANSLLATLISFANEMASVCEAAPDLDVETVMDGVVLDRRFTPLVDGRPVRPGAQSYLRAGAGFGGSCLPKDVAALRSFAAQSGASTALLDGVLAVNELRPERLVDLLEAALAGALPGKRVAVLGLAFKPGTDDLRLSPSLAVIAELRRRGADVVAWDPLIPTVPPPALGAGAEPVAELAVRTELIDALRGADAAVLGTAWPELRDVDWAAAAQVMSRALLVDGRNLLRDVGLPETLEYWPIGRRHVQASTGEGGRMAGRASFGPAGDVVQPLGSRNDPLRSKSPSAPYGGTPASRGACLVDTSTRETMRRLENGSGEEATRER